MIIYDPLDLPCGRIGGLYLVVVVIGKLPVVAAVGIHDADVAGVSFLLNIRIGDLLSLP